MSLLFSLYKDFLDNIVEEDIDGVALLQLTPLELRELGISQMGPRKRLESSLERIKKVFFYQSPSDMYRERKTLKSNKCRSSSSSFNLASMTT